MSQDTPDTAFGHHQATDIWHPLTALIGKFHIRYEKEKDRERKE